MKSESMVWWFRMYSLECTKCKFLVCFVYLLPVTVRLLSKIKLET